MNVSYARDLLAIGLLIVGAWAGIAWLAVRLWRML